MLRHIMALAVTLSITNCAWEKDDAQEENFDPNCSFTLAAAPVVTPSVYAEQLDVPHNQEKLLQLMTASDAPCYAKHQGKLKIFKIPIPNMIPVEIIGKLPAAPAGLQADWSLQEKSIGRPLLGLTTFNFHPAPDEKLVHATITLRETARMWHLWHEFSHYVIGQKRVEDPNKTIAIPDNKILQQGRDAFTEAVQTYWNQPSPENMDRVTAAFRRALVDQKNHLEKRYLDEVMIEATLIQTVSQSPQSFTFDRIDAAESMGTINFFMMQYRNGVQELEQQLLLPMRNIAQTAGQQKLVDDAIFEMREKVRALDLMYSEVSMQGNRLMQWQSPTGP